MFAASTGTGINGMTTKSQELFLTWPGVACGYLTRPIGGRCVGVGEMKNEMEERGNSNHNNKEDGRGKGTEVPFGRRQEKFFPSYRSYSNCKQVILCDLSRR